MDLNTYYWLIKFLDDLVLPDDLDTKQMRSFKNKVRQYIVKDGILYKKNKRNIQRPLRVAKPSEVEAILFNYHEDVLAGHFGFSETYRIISEKYFWPQMGDDIKRYIQSCDVCQRRQRPMKTESLHPLKVGRPFDRLGMDIVGPLPRINS